MQAKTNCPPSPRFPQEMFFLCTPHNNWTEQYNRNFRRRRCGNSFFRLNPFCNLLKIQHTEAEPLWIFFQHLRQNNAEKFYLKFPPCTASYTIYGVHGQTQVLYLPFADFFSFLNLPLTLTFQNFSLKFFVENYTLTQDLYYL